MKLSSTSIWEDKERFPVSGEISIGHDLEHRFIDALANLITKALRISYRDQEITKRFIHSAVEDTIGGYLEAYLNGSLETIAKTINRESGIDKKVNYNYALHAKFNSIIEEMKSLLNKK